MIKKSLTLNNLSKLGIGSAVFGMDYGLHQEISQATVNEILDFASLNSMNMIDTAYEYGSSESKIGKYNFTNQSRFFISTKIKKLTHLMNLYEETLSSVNTSLKRLNKESIELLSLHQVDSFVVNNNDFWRAIETLKASRKIRYFGVSIYDNTDIKNILKNHLNRIDAVQLPYNLIDTHILRIIPILKAHNIKIIARSIFLRGLLAKSVHSIENENVKNVLNKMYEKHPHLKSASLKKIAFNYVYNNSDIDFLIIGIKDAVELSDIINLQDKQLLLPKNIDTSHLKKSDYDPRQW